MTKQKWSMEAFIHISLVKSQCSKMTCLEWSQNLICHASWKWCLQASSWYWNLNNSPIPQTFDLNRFSDICPSSCIPKQNINKSGKKNNSNWNIVKHHAYYLHNRDIGWSGFSFISCGFFVCIIPARWSQIQTLWKL